MESLSESALTTERVGAGFAAFLLLLLEAVRFEVGKARVACLRGREGVVLGIMVNV